jgi:hypothetical protein
MKRLILAAVCLSVFSLSSLAQTPDTFDIASFRSPKGWNKQPEQYAVKISTSAGDDFCLITLFKSLSSLGMSKTNFQASWETIVKDSVSPTSAPQMAPIEDKDGWAILSGYAPFEKDGSKGIAVLVNATGFGQMVNVMILTNTQAYERDISAFLDSIRLKKPAVAAQPQPQTAPTAPAANGSQPALAGNFWKMGSVAKGTLGFSGISPATFAATYQFFGNGTYKFSRENMQLAAPKYYLESEEGTYTVSGDTITITSKRSSYSQHRLKKEEPPIKSGNLPLSTVRYRYEFWFYDNNWRLLLSPVDGNETKRDGTFGFYRNGEPQRTYQFHLVDATGK